MHAPSRLPFATTSIVVASLWAACSVTAANAQAADPTPPPATPDLAAGIEFFETRIRPVLADRCYACHSAGAESLQAGLRLDHPAGIRSGGARGPAVVPFEPDASLLLSSLRYTNEDLQMPPADAGGPLTREQVADFETWIKVGAPLPETDVASLDPAADHAARHWAFQKVGRPQPPAVVDPTWAQTDVDPFILAALEAQGLTPSPPASRRALLRRLKYDLLGLPPTYDEIAAFERDDSPSAYAELIERYLSSPHYGERWGRYWLDVARYADTKGYVYAREERRFFHSHAYRDWVIRSFNDDLPYDLFLIRQLAADQLPNEDPASLAALGFLTIGRRFINVIHDIIDDRIDVVCRGTMGLTVSCARCHDHKFDPIPTQDYYSLYGVFQGSSEHVVALAPAEATPQGQAFAQELAARQTALAEQFRAQREELFEHLRSKSREYVAQAPGAPRLPSVEFYMTMTPEEINPVFVRQWHAYITAAGTRHSIFAPWNAVAARPAEQGPANLSEVLARLAVEGVAVNPRVAEALAALPLASLDNIAVKYGELFEQAHAAWKTALETAQAAGTEAPAALADPHLEALRAVLYGSDSPIYLPTEKPSEAEFFFYEKGREALGQAQAKIDQWLVEAAGAAPHALALEDVAIQRNPRVLVRGNPKVPGVEVPRRALAIIAGPDRQPFKQGSGRLELARAIASPDNPLTARVLVNRLWLAHFGTGLVSTPSDFGLRSDPPSHPELLDYLAGRLVDGAWSIKNIHRLILRSAVYQQASVDRPAARRTDPANRLYWRMNPRRLDFEATRDTLLAISGQLDATVGGRAVDLTSQPFPRRRTLYGYIDRLNLPTMYRAFDFASPDSHSPHRYQTMVPQHALFLMNHPFVLEQARHLAALPEIAAAATPEEKVQALYRRVFARTASPEEVALAQPLVEAPPTDSPVLSAWSYGQLDPANTGSAAPPLVALPYFNGQAWHAGPQIPELKCGWPTLLAQGGQVGREPSRVLVRRWTAPRTGRVDVSGTLNHRSDAGDGVHARLVHSRLGELAAWTLHRLETSTAITGLAVEAGDTLDFAVDGRQDSEADDFSWAPVIRMAASGEGDAKIAEQTWDAAADFAGPADPVLGPWERYSHVLLQSNELVFVD